MNIKNFALATLMGVALNSCVSPREMVFQVPVVSMTKSNTGNIKQLSEGEPVSTKWCWRDTPVVKSADGSNDYGLIDQVIYAAHHKTKADYFVNARAYIQQVHNFFAADTICAYLEANVGITQEGKSEGAEPSEPTDAAPTKKKTKAGKPTKG